MTRRFFIIILLALSLFSCKPPQPTVITDQTYPTRTDQTYPNDTDQNITK